MCACIPVCVGNQHGFVLHCMLVNPVRSNNLQCTLCTLVSLLLVSTKLILAIFKIHDLVGINFNNFTISSSDTVFVWISYSFH